MPKHPCCVFGAAVLLASLLRAGEVRGFVTNDLGGDAIANAEIRLLSGVNGAVEYRTKASRNGAFSITGVQPGVYAIRAWLPGFREEVRPGFVVRGDSILDIGKFPLVLGGATSPAQFVMTLAAVPRKPLRLR